MVKKRLLVLITVIFVLSLFYVKAQDFQTNYQVIKDTIVFGEEAEFNIFITNTGASDTFKISVFNSNWVGVLDNYLVEVPKGAERSSIIKIRPTGNVKEGINNIGLIISSVNDPYRSVQIRLAVNIVGMANLVKVSVDGYQNIDPNVENTLKINFRNTGSKDLEKLEVEFESEVVGKTFYVDLKKNEEKSANLDLKFDETVRPGNYEFKINVKQDGKLVGFYIDKLNVVKSADIKEKKSFQNGVFVDVVSVAKLNNGNSEAKSQIILEIPWTKKLFTKLYPEPSLVENGKYTWNFNLKPSEEFTAVAITDYRPTILVALLVLLFFVVVVSIISKKVLIRKRVVVIKDDEGKNMLKVILNVKNNRGVDLHKIRVIDRLPPLVKQSEEFGTLKPSKIERTEHHIKLVWDLPNLSTDEERLISYNIKSNIDILGRLFLPRATVKYIYKGKEISASSNLLTAILGRWEKLK